MSVFKQDSFLNNSSLACNSLTEEVNKMSANDKRPSTSKIDENPFAGEMYDDDDGFNTRFNNLYNALFNEKINKTETQDLVCFIIDLKIFISCIFRLLTLLALSIMPQKVCEINCQLDTPVFQQ